MSEPLGEPGDSEAPSFRRLHPLSWLFLLAAQVRTLIVPSAMFLVAGEGSALRFLLLLFLVPAAIQPLFRFFSFRYQLRSEEMVVREGVLFRNERRIPYSRIHNVDLVQNPFHRLARVAVVRLETASGGKPEAVIRVLSLAAVEELRGFVRQTDPSQTASDAEGGPADAAGDQRVAATTPAPVILLRLPPVELVKLGLVSNRGMVALAAAAAFVAQQDLVPWDDIAWERLPQSEWLLDAVRLAEGTASDVGWLAGILVAGMVGLAAVAALYLLSIALAFRFYGFTLSRLGDFLRAEFGLLTRVAQTTPRQRIQCLRVQQSLPHRILRRSSVQIDTAGGGGPQEAWASGGFEGGSSRQWLAPLIDPAEVPALLRQAMPQVPEPETWRPIAVRAWRRHFRQHLVLWLIATAIASPFSLWALLAIPVGTGLSLVAARWYVRHRHYAWTDHALLWRYGRWSRTLAVVPFNKIQAVLLGQTPFDRHHRMASVKVDTAGAGALGYAIDIPYVELEEAEALVEALNREVAGRAFRWR